MDNRWQQGAENAPLKSNDMEKRQRPAADHLNGVEPLEGVPEKPNRCDNLVMIVEDNRDVRKLLGMLLEQQDYQHIDAANGQEALDKLHASPVMPCVILLDIMMPIMDGWHFRALQRMDPEPAIANIPVVVVTAHATLEVNHRMRAAAVLRMPSQLGNLLSTIDRICRA